MEPCSILDCFDLFKDLSMEDQMGKLLCQSEPVESGIAIRYPLVDQDCEPAFFRVNNYRPSNSKLLTKAWLDVQGHARLALSQIVNVNRDRNAFWEVLF